MVFHGGRVVQRAWTDGLRAVENDANIKPTTIVDRETWIAQLSSDCTVTGPGLSRCGEQVLAARVVSSVNWIPRAETVGRLGRERYFSDGEDDLWKLSPQYYRRSAAEEKLKKP